MLLSLAAMDIRIKNALRIFDIIGDKQVYNLIDEVSIHPVKLVTDKEAIE